MLRRFEADDAAARVAAETVQLQPAILPAGEAEHQSSLLPHDHPRWVRDAVAVSRAARELIAKLKPIALHVMSIWDHRFRCIAVAGQRVSVDPSGSYRID